MGHPKVGEEYDGRYRVVRRIGHGGMGVVYEAVDTVLDRPVALKVVQPSLADRDDLHARFAREASVLARIRSRGIVGIHHYGEHEATVYLVTELYPDGDLRSWLAEHGPLDRRAALSLVASVCEALADAHAAGVVHRDVKPGNVLLWNRPEGLVPYLADFGIALDSTVSDDQEQLTRAGTLLGSPAYMAPERHFGHAADERGDVYSAGCLLWTALTGDAPYAGTDFQVINSHVSSPTPRLDTGEPVDDRIDELLAHVLHKDPAQRVGSAQELREALLSIIRDIDAAAAGAAAGPAPAAAGRRRGRLLAGGAAGLAAAVVLAAVAVASTRGGAEPVAGGPAAASGSAATSPALVAPRGPRASARAAYRAVRFVVAPPRVGGGLTRTVEYDAGQGWQPLRDRWVTVPTEEGGDRACVRTRTTVEDVDGRSATSEVVRVCGRAQARVVRLVRSPAPCSTRSRGSTYRCTWYGVEVTGFEPGTRPRPVLRSPLVGEWCEEGVECAPIPVGRDGRGRVAQLVRVARDEGLVTLVVDGVTTRTRVAS